MTWVDEEKEKHASVTRKTREVVSDWRGLKATPELSYL